MHVETYLSLECIDYFRKKKVVTVFPGSMLVPECLIFCGKCSTLDMFEPSDGPLGTVQFYLLNFLCVAYQ